MSRENILMVADSEHDANMLYAVGLFVPDPFIYLRTQNKGYIVVSDMELDRARMQARHCRVISLSRCQQQLRRQGVSDPRLADVVRLLLRERRLKKVQVPANFPFGLAQQMRRLKLKIKTRDGSFFPDREFKTAEEVKKISAAIIMAEVGLSEALQVLKSSKIGRNGRLYYHEVPLTSDKLRSVINVAILQAGGLAVRTIVAGGRQGCDPHEPGHGVLRAHQPIIIDVFPRSQKTGYFGDITRTVVKGRASESVRRLYQTVARGQTLAIARLRHLVPGVEVHRVVQEFFAAQGYKTCRHNGRMQGFFHATGHGLGLELHEPPRISLRSTDLLRAGHVVAVEPGLYFPEIGGVRLEDVALVTRKAPVNLTESEKVLEI
jgi:Xaa-Pro aminopeptidase